MHDGLIAFAAMLALVFLRVPIAFAMGAVGFAGFALKIGWAAAAGMVGTVTYETGFAYTLSVVPLFILMGNFVTRAGLSEELYTASYAFLGHRRGGLAMATILACGGFGAICGSSLATAATMAKVAMPSMRRYGYSDALAAGSIAAGGTLGILIPPSVIMIIYGLLTETDIGKLFIAGILPGLVAISCYLAAVSYATWRDPAAGPRGERFSLRQRLVALRGVWGVLLLFGIVMGGIYGGVFTPTEAAGIGAAGAFLFTILRRAMSPRVLYEVLIESAQTTAMIFVILIGALIFANFINVTTMPGDLKAFVAGFEIRPIVVILFILTIYIALGCVLESLSMILLTVPLFYPLVAHLGYDLIWFGIVVVVVTEISLITPPVGMNVFVLRTVLADVPTGTVFRGVTPFIVADIVRLGILVAFPAVSLLLPRLMR
jgi:C4-dicarboxylate transporter, DctM subunit